KRGIYPAATPRPHPRSDCKRQNGACNRINALSPAARPSRRAGSRLPRAGWRAKVHTEKRIPAMIELKQLSFFLGCPVEWMGERGYALAGINTADKGFNHVGLRDDSGICVWVLSEDIRPILRPLSDMTA